MHMTRKDSAESFFPGARRGLASPDRADALMLTHAVDPAPKETQTNERPARRPTNWMSV